MSSSPSESWTDGRGNREGVWSGGGSAGDGVAVKGIGGLGMDGGDGEWGLALARGLDKLMIQQDIGGGDFVIPGVGAAASSGGGVMGGRAFGFLAGGVAAVDFVFPPSWAQIPLAHPNNRCSKFGFVLLQPMKLEGACVAIRIFGLCTLLEVGDVVVIRKFGWSYVWRKRKKGWGIHEWPAEVA